MKTYIGETSHLGIIECLSEKQHGGYLGKKLCFLAEIACTCIVDIATGSVVIGSINSFIGY